MAGIKVFDGEKFNVWKSSMDILFEYKKVHDAVYGVEKIPPEATSTQEQITAWKEKNAHARMLIMQAVSSRVMEDLISCSTAALMWTKLRAIHQQKSAENIYLVTAEVYDYKMAKGDSVQTYLNHIEHKASILKDLGQPLSDSQIITKIFMSLPPSFNDVLAAWANVPVTDQTVSTITTRLLQHEQILKAQGGAGTSDTAFFTRGQSHFNTKKLSKLEQQAADKQYIQELKERTKCYNCGGSKHWSRDCPEPPRNRRDSKENRDPKYSHSRSYNNSRDKYHSKQSNACVVATASNSSRDSSPLSATSCDDDYAFVVISEVSQALSCMDNDIWYGDTGAIEHMTDRREWFSDFNSVPQGTWYVAVADDRKLPVRGTGTVKIIRTIDGQEKTGTLQGVLYIPDLRRNLFSIGLATEHGLSLTSKSGRCELHHADGTGPKVLEGIRHGKLFILSFRAIPFTQPATISFGNLVSTSPFSKTGKHDINLWHKRMAHVNFDTLKFMFDKDCLDDFFATNFDVSPSVCEGCALGKQHKATYKSDPAK